MLTIITKTGVISAVQNIYMSQPLKDSPDMYMVRVRPIGKSYSDEEIIYSSQNFVDVRAFYKRIADQVAAGVTVIDLRKMMNEEGK